MVSSGRRPCRWVSLGTARNRSGLRREVLLPIDAAGPLRDARGRSGPLGAGWSLDVAAARWPRLRHAFLGRGEGHGASDRVISGLLSALRVFFSALGPAQC